MRFLLTLFCFNFLLSPIYDFIDKVFGIKLFILDKVIALTLVIFLVLKIILSLKLNLNKFEFSFAFITIIISILSLMLNGFKLEIAFSHYFFIIMPFAAISFGASNDFYVGKYIHIFERCARICFPILILLLPLYLFIHHATSLWAYFGYSSGLTFAFLLQNRRRKSLKIFSYMFLDLLSGKRSAIVLWVVTLTLRHKKTSLLLILMLISFLLFSNFQLMPQRYLSVFYMFSSNENALAIATGGRSSEWISIFRYLSEQPSWWLYGGGFGNSYTLVDTISGFTEERHYVHNQLITHVYLFGPIPAVMFQIYLIFSIIKIMKYKHLQNHIILFIIFFVLSFLSASLMVEALPWIIFGYLRSSIRRYEIDLYNQMKQSY